MKMQNFLTRIYQNLIVLYLSSLCEIDMFVYVSVQIC